MNTFYTQDQLFSVVALSQKDIEQINLCRRDHNKLGFSYQLSFVRLINRFPIQQPFEILDDLLNYVSIHACIPVKSINLYTQRQQTISEHQERIRKYLNLRRFKEQEQAELKQYIFDESCRLEQTGALLSKSEQFLKQQKILKPSADTLKRLIGNQRKDAQQYIFNRISSQLSAEFKTELDSLLEINVKRQTPLYFLKQVPGRPSPTAIQRLTNKIEQIENTAILKIDLSWLNNNFQRSLTRYTKKCDAKRLRELEQSHRYAALTCFLWQVYRDTVDHLIDMFDKLINRIYNHAQGDIDNHNKSQRKNIRESLKTLEALTDLILDDTLDETALRYTLFKEIGKDRLLKQNETVKNWLNGKHSHVFNLVKSRFSYIRQFSPSLLKHIHLQFESSTDSDLSEALKILKDMNEDKKRKLPENIPVGFIPKKILPLVVTDEGVNKPAWECALLTAIRDEIKNGNISVKKSKQFGRLDDFFTSEEKWKETKDSFFLRAGLPCNPDDVREYLIKRLNKSFDSFLDQLPNNTYAGVDEAGWHLSVDPADQHSSQSKQELETLKRWLSSNMRVIKLPELLIEVDNELRFSRHFMPENQQENIPVDTICATLATIMAHGCNIGPYTMSHLIEGVSYKKIKHITDWFLTEETQRQALAQVVNAISSLDITQYWGDGTTSSSDGQRFSMNRKVLQQTYSPKFNDFAMEFYSFVADNYAPYYSMPIECTDRDAPYVLDGLLYNESDLQLEEHFTDTHGYTENNFAAFAMLGRKFSPRIRGLQKQRIYRIDTEKDYKVLSPLVNRKDRTIKIDWIVEQWDRLGHFYASLENGHVTASTAMKRLNGYSGKNHFFRANRELGRIFKTEHILQYMSDKNLRQKIRRGLLKGEQIHALARDLNYGKRGRLSNGDLQEQKNSCSCMTLILASIIYWQAKEINRVVNECDPAGNGINLKLMEHVSPITWDNVILYGEYVLDRNLINNENALCNLLN